MSFVYLWRSNKTCMVIVLVKQTAYFNVMCLPWRRNTTCIETVLVSQTAYISVICLLWRSNKTCMETVLVKQTAYISVMCLMFTVKRLQNLYRNISCPLGDAGPPNCTRSPSRRMYGESGTRCWPFTKMPCELCPTELYLSIFVILTDIM